MGNEVNNALIMGLASIIFAFLILLLFRQIVLWYFGLSAILKELKSINLKIESFLVSRNLKIFKEQKEKKLKENE